jgi:hypothetical protein
MFRLPQLLLNATLAGLAWSQFSANESTYTNPILSAAGADPWVIRHNDWYYMTYTTNEHVTLLRSQRLTCVPPSPSPQVHLSPLRCTH